MITLSVMIFNSVNFESAEFSKQFSFRKTKFSGEANFGEAKFDSNDSIFAD